MPDISVSTPTLTVLSEICALAAPDSVAKAAAQARVLSFFICIVCLRLVRMVVTRALSGRAAQTPSVWCSQSIFPGNSSALMVAMISPCSST